MLVAEDPDINRIQLGKLEEIGIGIYFQIFKEAGKMGLWTKADAQTHFDDLTVSGKP